MTRLACSQCMERPATSTSTGKCAVCLYAEVAGRERADAQVQAAQRDRERRKPPKAAKP